MLDEHDLGRIIDFGFSSPGDRLFRMEAAPLQPLNGTEVDDFRHYIGRGPLVLDSDRKEAWLTTVRSEEERGLISQRTRLFGNELTDYERYETECCLVLNDRAGDATGVLRHGEHSIPEDILWEDFWLVNDDILIVMHYDGLGRFTGADLVEDRSTVARYARARDASLVHAEPIAAWWARHREWHRDQRAA